MRPVYGRTKSYQDGIAEKRRKILVAKAVYIGLAGFLLFAGAVYVVFFSGIFDILSVKVSGLESLEAQPIVSKVEKLISSNGLLNTQKNVLFFDNERARKELAFSFPIFSSIIIEKDIPHDIIVKVSERKPLGVWCFENGKDCSLFDEDGVVWGKALPSTGSLLVSVNDSNNRSLVERDLIEAVRTIYNSFESSSIRVILIWVHHGLPEDVKVQFSDGWYALMTTEHSILEQINSLKAVIAEIPSQSVIQYLDTRVQGRVYYK